jgi:hypothetical protein
MKSAVSYEEYDKKLIEAIEGGCDTYGALCSKLETENKAIHHGRDWERVTDRRLTALKKKGFLIFADRKWHVQG